MSAVTRDGMSVLLDCTPPWWVGCTKEAVGMAVAEAAGAYELVEQVIATWDKLYVSVLLKKGSNTIDDLEAMRADIAAAVAGSICGNSPATAQEAAE